MKNNLRPFLTASLTVALCILQPGQSSGAEDTAARQVQTDVYFPIGKSQIDPTFENNRRRLNTFTASLNKILADSTYEVSRITVIGTTSPHSKEEINIALAGRRAQTLADYIVNHSKISIDKIEVINGGQGRNAVDELSQPEIRQKVKAGAMTASGMSFYYKPSASAKARVAKLQERTPPPTAVAQPKPTAQTKQPKQTKPTAQPALKAFPTQSVAKIPDAEKTTRLWRPVLGLKTDLLLWGGVMPGFELGPLTPNLSAEVYFAKRWSLQAEVIYADWNSLSGSKGLFAVDAYTLEPRIWYGKKNRFRGVYTGLYGAYGTFDKQEPGTGITGSYYTVGLSSGWVQALSRHWYLDLGIRLGYDNARCDHYLIHIDEGRNYLDYKSTYGKFSPAIRVGISYRIGNKGAKPIYHSENP